MREFFIMGLERFRGRSRWQQETPPATPELFHTLTTWGFENVRFLSDPNGAFAINPKTHRTYYGEYIASRFMHTHDGKTFFGNYEIPEPLLHVTNATVGESFTRNGLGHIRIARIMDLYCQILGIPSTLVDLTGGDHMMGKFFAEVYEHYRSGSRTAGKINGMASKLTNVDLGREMPITWITLAFAAWNLIDSKGMNNTLMGNANGNLSIENTKKALAAATAAMAPEYRRFLQSKGITHNVLVYPFLAMAFPETRERYVQLAPDSVVDPVGYPPPVILEHLLAKRHHLDAWGEEYADDITVSNGFLSPVGASVQFEKLLRLRSDHIKDKNVPLTLILPASGVATAQSKSFSDIISDCANDLRAGNLRIIVQTGYGKEGKALCTILHKLITDLGVENAVALHWAREALGAVDFFEAITSSPQPIAQAVKGSELTAMAVANGLPHIVTGTIGTHEQWNVITAILQGSPVFLLPEAYDLLEKFLSGLPHEYHYLVYRAGKAIGERRCQTISDAITRTRLAIENKHYAQHFNRHTGFDTLMRLFSTET